MEVNRENDNDQPDQASTPAEIPQFTRSHALPLPASPSTCTAVSRVASDRSRADYTCYTLCYGDGKVAVVLTETKMSSGTTSNTL